MNASFEDLQAVARALRDNGFEARVYRTRREAAEAARELIGIRSVGIGGSRTIEETGLYDTLKQQGNIVHWHWKDADVERARRRASQADVYLASSNAVTRDGHLINIDGTGNRVASMVWGPGEVLLIVGSNKICADDMAGVERVKTEACGRNARRLGLNTPCATLDNCTDCRTEDRMCRVTSLLERKPGGIRSFHIFLVDEPLGF